MLEEGARQSFIWALVAGFTPVCGLPVVWGLALFGRRWEASPLARRWFRRLLALAILDTLVALVCLHMAVAARQNPEAMKAPLTSQKVLGVITDPKYPGPGVRLAQVTARGPAKDGGLQVGDVVHRADGEPVDGHEALRDAVQASKPEGLLLEVEHEGERREVRIVPVEASALAPAPRGLFEPSAPEGPEESEALEGLRTMPRGWIGTSFVVVALVVLWGVGRRRGADMRPLAVLGVLGVAGLGALAALKGFSALLGGPSRGTLLLSLWAQGLILVAVSGLLVRRGAPGPEEAEGRGWLWTYFVTLGLFITLGSRVLVLLVWLSRLVSAVPGENAHPMLEMSRHGPMGVLGWVLLIVPAAVLAPIGEELLFRGVLLPWLRGWMGQVVALVVSAGLFASLHLFYGVFTLWIFYLGLMLGWARLASGGLRAPILLHATMNSFALLMFARSLMRG